MLYSGIQAAIIRKTYPELLSNHIRKLLVEYPFLKAWYKAGEKAVIFPNGSVLELKYLSNEQDVYGYQGIEYDIICLDEATQHSEEVFKILKTSLRSDPRLIARYKDFKPFFLLTGNPGGIGHQWVKRLFIDKNYNPNEKSSDYYFIQAKIYDNPLFLQANPEYIANLKELPTDLMRAYLDGDWTVFVGQFFTDWRDDIHIVEPFEIPQDWTRIFSCDWGYSPHPFHVGWYAIEPNTGKIYKYREYEDYEKAPDELANEILKKSEEETLAFGVGDTQMWAQNPFQTKSELGWKQEAYTDKSIALQMNNIFISKLKLQMFQANKDRATGWVELKKLMKWEGDVTEVGRVLRREPKFFVFKTCATTVARYPNMIHSELRPGDMVKQDGDDAIDTDRYAVMAIQEKRPQNVVNYLENEIKAIDKWEERLKVLYKNSKLIYDEREQKPERLY